MTTLIPKFDLKNGGSTPTGAINRPINEKLSEFVSVKDFGAVGDGVTSDLTAFQNAVDFGGTIYVPSGTYVLDSRLNITVDNVTIWLAADVTLLLSGTPPIQAPFGNSICFSANNGALIGSGASSVLQMAGTSFANAIGIVHHYGFLIRDVSIIGNKQANVPSTDDTFGSAISIIADSRSTATRSVEATVDNVVISNFYHYGLNIYGNLANGIKVTNCNIRDMGVAGDPLSVGAGIVVTNSVSDFTATNNVIKDCEQNGIFVSSAGGNCSNYVIANNACHQNGESGIAFLEQADFGCVAGQGITNIAITGNICTGNSRSGITLNVDTVGFLYYTSISGNVVEGNGYAGLQIGCTNTAPAIVSNVNVVGNQAIENAVANIGIGTYVAKVSGYSAPFTPVIQGSTTAGVGTYTGQNGSYVLVGNVVYFQLVLSWSAHTGTGNMQIGGLPYFVINAEPQSDMWVWANGITVTGQLVFGPLGGNDYGNIGYVNNGSYSTLAIQSSGSLRISGSYIATI